jgi:hypothetical protein
VTGDEERAMQVQYVRMLGLNLAGEAVCPRCLEPITPADGSFVAVRLPERVPLRFHLDCYREFAGGLMTFREEVLPHCTKEPVH